MIVPQNFICMNQVYRTRKASDVIQNHHPHFLAKHLHLILTAAKWKLREVPISLFLCDCFPTCISLSVGIWNSLTVLTPLPTSSWKANSCVPSHFLCCVSLMKQDWWHASGNTAHLISDQPGEGRARSPINSAVNTQLGAHISPLRYYILPINHQGATSSFISLCACNQ